MIDTVTFIETAADAGFCPGADADLRYGGSAWAASYYAHEAVKPLSYGFAVAMFDDGMIKLSVLTPSGVIRTEARFDSTELGLAMFAAAVAVL